MLTGGLNTLEPHRLQTLSTKLKLNWCCGDFGLRQTDEGVIDRNCAEAHGDEAGLVRKHRGWNRVSCDRGCAI